MKAPFARLAFLPLILAFCFGSHASFAQNGKREKRFIVLFKKQKDVRGVSTQAGVPRGAKLRHRYKRLVNAVAITADEEALKELAQDTSIEAIVEDAWVYATLSQSVPQIAANQVHTIGVDGRGVKVCLVDTGIDKSHPDLPDPTAQHDFANNDEDVSDDNGHGTHVAGIVASHNALYGGVAPGASLMVAKVLNADGGGYTSDVIAGMDWCVSQGADIINLSLGGAIYSGICTDPLAQAASNAVSQGVAVFAASGNDGNDNGLRTPSCGLNVIAVGAVDKSDARTAYSNEGARLSIVAPGSDIVSAKLGGGFVSATGTSMATPHAAGVGALILQTNPSLTPSEIKNVMQASARDLGAAGFDTIYGYGLIDAYAAHQQLGSTPGEPANNEILFAEDFGVGLNNWVESNELDWTTRSALEALVPNSTAQNQVGYASLCSSSLGCFLTQKNALDLTGYDNATLTFWRYVDNDLDAGEFLKVEAWNGTSWQTLKNWTNGSGDDDLWHKETISLQGFLVSDFRVRFISRENTSTEDTQIDDVVITGSFPPGNRSPIAKAGPDQSVSDHDNNGTETLTLNASNSSDPDGSITTYAWREGATLLGSSAVLPAEFSVGQHTVELRVTDNSGQAATDTLVVAVSANQKPVANAGNDKNIVDVNNDGAESVILDASASQDPDGSLVAYEWRKNGNVLGQGKVISVSLPQGIHPIELIVTDNGGGQSTDNVTIAVSPPSASPVSQLIFFDDFQSGSLSKWIKTGLSRWKIWAPAEKNIVGQPVNNLVANADQCNSSTGCIITLSSPIDLRAYSSAKLSFHRYVDDGLDSGEFLKVDLWNGVSWVNIYNWTYGRGNDDLWHLEEFDLSGFLVNGFKVRFISKETLSTEDTDIDNIRIEGVLR